jgi:hypothetical protein
MTHIDHNLAIIKQYKRERSTHPNGGSFKAFPLSKSSTTTMPIKTTQLSSLEDDILDLMATGKIFLYITSPALLWGQSAIAASLSALSVYVLQDTTRTSSTKNLEKWTLLSFISTVASLGSWVFLHLASRVENHTPESFKMWFVAMALQKVMGLTIAYFLYKDWKVKPTIEPKGAIRFSDIKVRVLQGRNLVAKDKNIWGRHTSSDPYVVLRHGPNKMGKTSIIKKTLDPTWNDHSFNLSVAPRTIGVYNSIECRIFDHDILSSDDAMGTVFVPIPTENNSKVRGWYPVENGQGENHCRNASGELLIEIEIRSQLAMSFKKQLHSKSQRFLNVDDEDEDDE